MAILSSSANAHLAWITKVSSHYDFGGMGGYRGVAYHDCMLNLYSTQPAINADAQRWFNIDTVEYEKVQETVRLTVLRAKKMALATQEIEPLFITIGFNHQTWSVNKCLKVIKTVTELGWVKSCRAVFELHRDNGLHPHCHFYIVPSVRYSKSKVLEKLWATAGIKGVVLQKSFIDYKLAGDHHLNYIMLRKTCDKMPFVELDNKWRSDNKIGILEVDWQCV